MQKRRLGRGQGSVKVGLASGDGVAPAGNLLELHGSYACLEILVAVRSGGSAGFRTVW